MRINRFLHIYLGDKIPIYCLKLISFTYYHIALTSNKLVIYEHREYIWRVLVHSRTHTKIDDVIKKSENQKIDDVIKKSSKSKVMTSHTPARLKPPAGSGAFAHAHEYRKWVKGKFPRKWWRHQKSSAHAHHE